MNKKKAFKNFCTFLVLLFLICSGVVFQALAIKEWSLVASLAAIFIGLFATTLPGLLAVD